MEDDTIVHTKARRALVGEKHEHIGHLLRAFDNYLTLSFFMCSYHYIKVAFLAASRNNPPANREYCSRDAARDSFLEVSRRRTNS